MELRAEESNGGQVSILETPTIVELGPTPNESSHHGVHELNPVDIDWGEVVDIGEIGTAAGTDLSLYEPADYFDDAVPVTAAAVDVPPPDLTVTPAFMPTSRTEWATPTEEQHQEPTRKAIQLVYECPLCLDQAENLSCVPCGHVFCTE